MHNYYKFTVAQEEIQGLLKQKEGWNPTILAKKAGKSPQTTHNHLYQNSDLSANDYLLYKHILTSKVSDINRISDLKEKCFEIIELEMQLERDFTAFCSNDNIIDVAELEALKARKKVIIANLDKFINLVEAQVNQVMDK